MNRTIRARTVLTMDGPPLDDGAVVIEGGRIVAVGKWSAERRAVASRVDDLGEVILLPGLINAHCHLDYTMLRKAITPPRSFTDWVRRINALKRSLADEDYLAAIAAGFEELARWGTTTVCNIESFPELMPRLPAPPIRTWWFYEMIDLRPRDPTEELVAGALQFFEKRREWLGGYGLSPHASYTASPELYDLAGTCAREFHMPVTTHLAESREEYRMFHDAEGPLHDFVAGLGRPMDDCGHGSPFATLLGRGSIGPGWLLAHMNELDAGDLDLLARQPHRGDFHVVHCPQSHSYFAHSPFPLAALRAAGVNLCLGTDSLASAEELSLFAELRALLAASPWLAPEEALRMATVNPARALGQAGRLGRIVPGACADLIAVPGAAGEAYEAVMENRTPIDWMMIDGEICN